MPPRTDAIAGAERALEGLFRLSMSRQMHDRQSRKVGADVTRAGYAVLRVLDEHGSCAMGELARHCAMDPAVVARQARKLEGDGLLARGPDAADRRVSVAELTERGARVCRAIEAERRQYLRGVLADWSDGDVRRLARLVDRLVEDLTEVAPLPVAGSVDTAGAAPQSRQRKPSVGVKQSRGEKQSNREEAM